MAERPTPNRIAVIMAGGSGERFWPLSRRNKPKQLLPLTHPSKSMLTQAVERLETLIPREDIYVATGRNLVGPIRQAGIGIADENVLAEPCKRNTAGCLMYATAALMARYGDEAEAITMAVTTADHRIGDDDAFRECVQVAIETTEREDDLVIVGIVPSRAETGFGYIHVDDLNRPLYQTHPRFPVFPVAAFKEKPGPEQAEQFFQSGHYFWNSGMFFWRVGTFLAELAQASPERAEATREMAAALAAGDTDRVEAVFAALPSEPIDIALMEKTKRVLVVKGDFPWDDVGAWPTLERSHDADPDGNITVGEPILVDCRGSIIYNHLGAESIAVCAVGVEDLVVVVTEDGVLVMPKERAQDVRKALEEMKGRGARQL